MLTLHALPLRALDGLDLMPLGQIGQAPAALSRHNRLIFTPGQDELDSYVMCALELRLAGRPRESVVLALRAYRNGPPRTVDVLLPAALAGDAALLPLLQNLVAALDLPPTDLLWPEPDRTTRWPARAVA